MARRSRGRRVLVVAFAFPPFLPVGHSIRAVKFTKYLPAFGWTPLVLTIDDRKDYDTVRKVGSDKLLREVQPEVKIHRTRSGEPSLAYIESEKRFGKRNWLTALLAKIVGGTRRWAIRNILLPDRHIAWLPFAVRRGSRIVREEGVDVIFATCPPHSVALIGACMRLLTGKPLVLDFRDDWVDTPWYRSRSRMRQIIERHLEGWVVRMASAVILVTESSRDAFLHRYQQVSRDRFLLIPNGCDLDDLVEVKSMAQPSDSDRFTILHAGSLNDSEDWARSPRALFEAVREILEGEPSVGGKLRLVFAGDFPPGHLRIAKEMGIDGLLETRGHLPHSEILRVMKSADLLVAINYEGFATLIPGKIYEYWAVGGAPILLLSCHGAASDLVDEHRLGFTVDPSDVEGIRQTILRVYRWWEDGVGRRVDVDGIEAFDRKVLAGSLADALARVALQA
jgi:glycosyltransferase involved in cell wall biosynthesis